MKYEADSVGSLLVLLNISLTQEMKDEGVSREVINRIQKLKKKAKLVPTDEVTIFYQVKDGYVADVIKSHFEKIQSSVRATVMAGSCPMYADAISDAKEEMKGEFLPGKTIMNLQVAHGTIDPNAPQKISMKFASLSIGPAGSATILLENPRGVTASSSVYPSAGGDSKMPVESKFVNLQFVGKDRYSVVKSNTATIVLNNPKYEIENLTGVRDAAARLFGWNGDESAVGLFFDAKATKKVEKLSDCVNQTVFVSNVLKEIS